MANLSEALGALLQSKTSESLFPGCSRPSGPGSRLLQGAWVTS
jgi:hypothetical protein